jgi:hypothetical protein
MRSRYIHPAQAQILILLSLLFLAACSGSSTGSHVPTPDPVATQHAKVTPKSGDLTETSPPQGGGL